MVTHNESHATCAGHVCRVADLDPQLRATEDGQRAMSSSVICKELARHVSRGVCHLRFGEPPKNVADARRGYGRS